MIYVPRGPLIIVNIPGRSGPCVVIVYSVIVFAVFYVRIRRVLSNAFYVVVQYWNKSLEA